MDDEPRKDAHELAVELGEAFNILYHDEKDGKPNPNYASEPTFSLTRWTEDGQSEFKENWRGFIVFRHGKKFAVAVRAMDEEPTV